MNFKFEEHSITGLLDYGNLPVTGNSEYGYSPSDLLVSSIVGCSGGVLRNILKKKRISYENLSMKVNVIKNEKTRVKTIEKIQIKFIFSGNQLNEKSIQDAVALTPKYCPMVQSVKGTIQVEGNFVIR